MYTRLVTTMALAWLGTEVIQGQGLDQGHRHTQIVAIVPMTGAGTAADPRRPLFLPGPNEGLGGILAYSFEMSDDGTRAIATITARDLASVAAVVNSRRPDVRVFVKGRDRKEDIERELRRHRASGDVRRFLGGRP